MVLPNNNPSSSLPSSSFCYCYDGGSSSSSTSSSTGGPMYCASNNQTFTSCVNDMIYHVGSSGGASFTDPLSSSGAGTSMSVKTASFSESQLQELERQRCIYRYMMASVPVPAELLMTNSKNQSNSTLNERGSSLKLGIASSASNGMDLEPWRCRRTDGKKWRCSRNVIPDQKYCERHSHKSRPRSRKPVETPPHTVNHSASTIAAAAMASRNTTDQFHRTYLQNPSYYAQSKPQFSVYPTLPSASSSYDQHRGLRWFMNDDEASMMNTSNDEMREMVQLKVGSNQESRRSEGSNSLGFDYHLNFRHKDEMINPSFGSLEGLLTLNGTHAQETRHFFDAESDEAIGSSLTLSMAGASGNEETANPQMGMNHHWMSQEGLSWLSSPPGGPLAEALCLGSATSNPSSSLSSCSRAQAKLDRTS